MLTAILVRKQKWRKIMPNYQKMYALLCGAIDEVLDPLEKIPLATPYAKQLQAALEAAEELYLSDTDSSTA